MLLLEGVRINRKLIFVELDLILVSGSSFHRAVSGLDEAYRGLLLPAGIIIELDHLSLLGLNDLGLHHGLDCLPAAFVALGLDLRAQRLLTIPLVYKF